MTTNVDPESWNGSDRPRAMRMIRMMDFALFANYDRSKPGRFAVCIAQTGDCVYKYLVLKETSLNRFQQDGTHEVQQFGLDRIFALIPEREYYELLAGRNVKFPPDWTRRWAPPKTTKT